MNSLRAASADRLLTEVALLCMIGSRAKDRCTFTTDLTPPTGRGPPAADGRLKSRGTAIKQPEQQFCCRLLFKVGQFYGITQPAALIMPQNPRRNLYGPMKKQQTLLSYLLLHRALHFTLGITPRNVLTFIVVVLTLAKTDLYLHVGARKIKRERDQGVPVTRHKPKKL